VRAVRRAVAAVLHLQHRLAQPGGAARTRTARYDVDLHEVGDTQEVGHVGVGRLLVDLVRGADLHDPPVAHDRQPVGHGQPLFLVVRDVQERDPDLLLQRLEFDLERAAQLGVEGAEWLAEQRTDGWSTRARASATRCCWPPDSWPGRRLAKARSLTRSSASFTRRVSSPLSILRVRSPNATLSNTVRNGNRA
jgi:hypothetical protein